VNTAVTFVPISSEAKAAASDKAHAPATDPTRAPVAMRAAPSASA